MADQAWKRLTFAGASTVGLGDDRTHRHTAQDTRARLREEGVECEHG